MGSSIQTYSRLQHNRPDIVVIDKTKKVCYIIDVACPGDSSIMAKEEDKIETNKDLAYKIKSLWKMKKVFIIPVVIGALGSVTDRIEKFLSDI